MKPGTIVVGMLTHRDPEQIQRVADRVCRDSRFVVVVHHDPRGPELNLRGDRILVVPDAAAAPWGSTGVARAQLKVVEHSLKAVPDMSWLLLISGADYPCHPIAGIADELENTSADAFVRWFRSDGPPELDTHHWQAVTRRRYLKRIRLPRTYRSIPFPRRSPFRAADTNLYVGDLWVNLNARAARHVMAQQESRQDIVRYLNRCSIPDEALLPSLLLNGDAGLRVEADHRRFIRWVEGSPHPEQLVAADVPAMLESGAFFARKFDPTLSGEAMDLLDQSI